VQTNSK